jgi:hypothetical protein
MGSAVLRAARVREDAPPWVLEDSLSERLLDHHGLEEVRAEIARWAPGVRAAFRLSHAVRSGVPAYVPRFWLWLSRGLAAGFWMFEEVGEEQFEGLVAELLHLGEQVA